MNVDSKLHTALSPQQLVELFHDRDIHQPKRRLDVIPYDKIINTDDIIDTLFSRNPFCVVFYPAAQANNTTFGHFVALCHDEHHKTVYFYDPLGYLPDEYKKFADKRLYSEHQNSLVRHMLNLLGENYSIDFNHHQHQSRQPEIATCGRHSAKER